MHPAANANDEKNKNIAGHYHTQGKTHLAHTKFKGNTNISADYFTEPVFSTPALYGIPSRKQNDL